MLLNVCMLCSVQLIYAQQTGVNDTVNTQAIIYEGDTLEMKTLEFAFAYAKLTVAQVKANAKYNRLRNAVYVTYPYARRAGTVMNDINEKMVNVKSKEERRNYIKSRD